MGEYGRGVEWYLSAESLYGHPPNSDRFCPAPNTFIEIWNYPVTDLHFSLLVAELTKNQSGRTDVVEGGLEPADVAEWLVRESPMDDDHNKPSGGLRLMYVSQCSPLRYSLPLSVPFINHGYV